MVLDPCHPGQTLMIPQDRVVPRAAWDRAPWNRWTFQHVRELMPTAAVRRGAGPVLRLPSTVMELTDLPFTSDGVTQTIGEFLQTTQTDGFLILHRDRIVLEYYANGMTPSTLHLSQSVAKSLVGTLAGLLAGRGFLDIKAPVTAYLPALERTAYRGATVQHLLDMTSGVAWDENYEATDSDIARMDVASGWKDSDCPTWPRHMWELVLTLQRAARPHGQLFAYRSIETDVLGFVLQQAGGASLAELLSRELWQPLGAEEDACFTVDPAGFPYGSGGFNATLRDYGRFALLYANGGRVAGKQLLPHGWVEEVQAANHARFVGHYREVLPRGAYHNQFWIEDPEQRVLLARGVFGQLIYLDPGTGFAGVKLSSWPVFVDVAGTRRALAAMRAIRAALG
ncbi:MAG TPA: serine hydrolase [Steroidobacteraceae bacterium]|nr:serine hydrolase [Steroidobacteraceae bacterium]